MNRAPSEVDAARDAMAVRQRALVEALVADGPVPAGFDACLLAVTTDALLRKRAGELREAWPILAAGLGSAFAREFAEWAHGRPPGGRLADGFAFATHLREVGRFPALAGREWAARRAQWSYRDGRLRRRRLGRLRQWFAGALGRLFRQD